MERKNIFGIFYFFIFVKERKLLRLIKIYMRFMVLIAEQNARVRIGLTTSVDCYTNTKYCNKKFVLEICNLPKVAGPCEGYYPQWYYDKEQQQCLQFIYGGCLGNNNRFETREECMGLCVKDNSIGIPIVTFLTNFFKKNVYYRCL